VNPSNKPPDRYFWASNCWKLLIAKEGPASDLNTAKSILENEIEAVEQDNELYGNEEGLEVLDVLDRSQDLPAVIKSMEQKIDLLKQHQVQAEQSIRAELKQKIEQQTEKIEKQEEEIRAVQQQQWCIRYSILNRSSILNKINIEEPCIEY